MTEEKSRGWLWVIAPLILVSLVIGYLWMPQPPPEHPVGPPVKTSIGVSATSLLASLVHVAKAQGYFLEEGLEVAVKGYPTGKAALNGRGGRAVG